MILSSARTIVATTTIVLSSFANTIIIVNGLMISRTPSNNIHSFSKWSSHHPVLPPTSSLAFIIQYEQQRQQFSSTSSFSSTQLWAKKKRRRKVAPKPTEGDQQPPATATLGTPTSDDIDVDDMDDLDDLLAVSARSSSGPTPLEVPGDMKKFTFDAAEAIALGFEDDDEDDEIPDQFANLAGGSGRAERISLPSMPNKKDAAAPSSSSPIETGALELPDIKNARKKRQSKWTEDNVDMKDVKKKSAGGGVGGTTIDRAPSAAEQMLSASEKKRISRTDKENFEKLLDEADERMLAFVEDGEDYNPISALLGEGATPFYGVPLSIIQIGHFIGALAIILMAFVEYPGFPLTNLPSPLRGAFQGGLGTVYLINTVLAVLAIFKAQERNQPSVLWFVKTFTIGGLAFDQLTQLPTTEQIELLKNKKGKRSVKKKKLNYEEINYRHK